MVMTIIPKARCCYEGRTNLDTLAWRTGRLTVGVFDDDRPGGPIDFIVVRGRRPQTGSDRRRDAIRWFRPRTRRMDSRTADYVAHSVAKYE